MRLVPILSGIVILAMWLGAAALVAIVVAPAAFAVLPTRTLAGALVGRVLPVIFWAGIVVGLITAGLSWSSAKRVSLIGALVMTVGCAVAQLIISPRIEQIRTAIGGPIDALDAADPRRLEFGRLHGLSVGTMGIAGIGALVTLIVFTRIAAARTIP